MASIQDMVFEAAKAGEADRIRELLQPLSQQYDIDIVLGPKTHTNGETTTPLLVAALYSHEEVVNLLINEYNVDVEQTGMVIYDGHLLNCKSGETYYVSHHAYNYRRRRQFTDLARQDSDDDDEEDEASERCVNGVTALWLACLKGYSSIVRLLIDSHGADVNKAAMDGSTPLRVSCVSGYTNIAQLLIENGADVNTVMKDNSTPLMIAALHRNRHEVKLLVKNGANVNTKTQPQGRTALHYAAQGGDYIIVINLMRNGAEFCEDLQGFNPIHIACMSKDADILEYLLSNFNCSTKTRIEAIELLGCAYITSDPSYDDLEQCWEKWKEALEERYEDMENIIHKRMLTNRSEIYERDQERQSLEELMEIKNKKEDIIFEAIMAQERILGANTMLNAEEIAKFLSERGNAYAELQNYERCHAFWLKAIAIRRQTDQSVSNDVMKFAELFEDMETRGINVADKVLWNVLEVCIEDIQNESYRVGQSESFYAIRKAQRNVHKNIHFMLFILYKLRTLTKDNDEDSLKLSKFVRRFNKLNVTGPENNSILHMCCYDKTRSQISNHYIRHAVSFPNPTLVELLLECGTKVNEVNENNETSLHMLALSSDFAETRESTICEQIQSIARLLIDYGAHIDGRNRDGLTAQDLCKNLTVAYFLKKIRSELPLKCLSAQIVKQFVPNYAEHLPSTLRIFVQSH